MGKTIKEYEVEKGIKVRDAKGFKGEKNKRLNKKYTEREFKEGIRTSIITVNTEKGLQFLYSD